jgi:glucose-1-phosphate thymidylyltransferase
MRNAILLSGGSGTRLLPLTAHFNKQMINVNGRFIIDYPLDTLKQMGIENLTVVLGDHYYSQIVDHLKDGSAFGMNINYVYQSKPSGIAQAIYLAKRYVADQDQFAVILGDNFFSDPVLWSPNKTGKAQIVVKKIPDLNRFGVISCNEHGDILSIVEKPQTLDDRFWHYAVTGCYLFDQRYFDYFPKLKKSQRGEFEIMEIVQAYHKDGLLHANYYDGFWYDLGTHQSIALVNDYFYQKSKTSDIETV